MSDRPTPLPTRPLYGPGIPDGSCPRLHHNGAEGGGYSRGPGHCPENPGASVAGDAWSAICLPDAISCPHCDTNRRSAGLSGCCQPQVQRPQWRRSPALDLPGASALGVLRQSAWTGGLQQCALPVCICRALPATYHSLRSAYFSYTFPCDICSVHHGHSGPQCGLGCGRPRNWQSTSRAGRMVQPDLIRSQPQGPWRAARPAGRRGVWCSRI